MKDAQGHGLIDVVMGWGALIVGHGHPSVLRAVRRGLTKSTVLGFTHQAEADLAKTIVEAFPSMDQVRLTTSGTEACMTAIRLARACTRRSSVLLFEGCYHGHSDGVLVKPRTSADRRGVPRSAGVPDGVAQDAIVVPYNDLDALEDVVARDGDTIACAMLEPVAANMGVVAASREFLRRLRHLTKRHGILLIFDEVVTGFRVTYGGAQTVCGITPDVTVLGKIIGGGFPIGALGGPRSLMQQLAPEGPVYHAGTFAGHPLAMIAGLATLQELRSHPPYAHLDSLGARLEEGLLKAAAQTHLAIQVNRMGSMLTVFFNESPVTGLATAERSNTARFATFAKRLFQAGVLLPPAPFEAMFLSSAHRHEMIDRMIKASSNTFAQLSDR